MKRKKVYLAVFAMSLFVFGGCGQKEEQTETTYTVKEEAKTQTEAKGEIETKTEAETETETTSNADKVYRMGETAEIYDWSMDSRIEITFTDFGTVQGDYLDTLYYAAYTVENTGTEEEYIGNFEIYADDNLVQQSYSRDSKVAATLGSGRKMEARLYISTETINLDNVNCLEVEYDGTKFILQEQKSYVEEDYYEDAENYDDNTVNPSMISGVYEGDGITCGFGRYSEPDDTGSDGYIQIVADGQNFRVDYVEEVDETTYKAVGDDGVEMMIYIFKMDEKTQMALYFDGEYAETLTMTEMY